MTKDEIREVAGIVRDMRFIQAAALVGSKLADEKKAKQYMARLNVLQDKLDAEALNPEVK